MIKRRKRLRKHEVWTSFFQAKKVSKKKKEPEEDGGQKKKTMMMKRREKTEGGRGNIVASCHARQGCVRKTSMRTHFMRSKRKWMETRHRAQDVSMHATGNL